MSNPALTDRFLTRLDEHRRILFKVAGAYARQADEREDLVQEMVLQLWRAWPKYDERRPFPTWMYRIALNVAISHGRGLRSGAGVRPRDDGGQAILQLAAPVEPDTSARDEDLARLQRFIVGLPELDRALLLLHLDGQRYEDIAEVLGLSTSNVGTKLNRLKLRLRRDWDTLSTAETRDGTR